MSTTCGMLQLAAEALDSFSPGEVLERVNETLLARIPQNMFVTCFYAILEPKSASLSSANAGHDPPTCGVEAMPTNLGPQGCLWGSCLG